MDKLFDNAKNVRDVNQIAADLLRIGLMDKIRALAVKYQLPERNVDDFLQRKRYFLIDAGNTTGVYKTARAKLLYEMDLLQDKNFGNVIGRYLLTCCEDREIEGFILQKHKTLQRCIEYLMKKALAMVVPEGEESPRQNVSVAVMSDSVFEWSKEYYGLNDKKEIEREEEEEEKRIKKCKNSPKTSGVKSMVKKSGSSKSVEQKKSGKESGTKCVSVNETDNVQDNQVNGQFSLFNM